MSTIDPRTRWRSRSPLRRRDRARTLTRAFMINSYCSDRSPDGGGGRLPWKSERRAPAVTPRSGGRRRRPRRAAATRLPVVERPEGARRHPMDRPRIRNDLRCGPGRLQGPLIAGPRLKADDAVDLLAAPEDQDRGDRADPV